MVVERMKWGTCVYLFVWVRDEGMTLDDKEGNGAKEMTEFLDWSIRNSYSHRDGDDLRRQLPAIPTHGSLRVLSHLASGLVPKRPLRRGRGFLGSIARSHRALKHRGGVACPSKRVSQRRSR